MTQPPTTVAEFEDLLAKAKAAGLQPIMQWNATASGGGLAFPLQNLMAAYGPTEPINDWIFQKSGTTIDTAANLTAAQHLEEWVKAGYFPEDANAIEYTDANARFGKGEGVFMFNGDWQNATYDKDLPGNVGFFVFPPAEAGGNVAAMSAPLTYGIATNAKNADCAAFFFNWVATNETARQINVDIGGSNPGGPTDLPVPSAAEGSVTNETLAAGNEVAKDNGGDGLHRERHGLHLRPGLDAGTAEAGRRPAGCCRPPEGGPGRVREGTQPLIHAADEAGPRSAIARSPVRTPVGGRPADPLARGSAGRPWSAGCSWPRPSSCTASSSCSRWP